MDVEGTIEFLLQHQARMAAENELFQAHQAEVRAEHEERFKRIEVAHLELSETLGARISELAGVVRDSSGHFRAGMEELRESQKHTGERLNALIQIVDDIIRRPRQ
jgi:hypothetical protein